LTEETITQFSPSTAQALKKDALLRQAMMLKLEATQNLKEIQEKQDLLRRAIQGVKVLQDEYKKKPTPKLHGELEQLENLSLKASEELDRLLEAQRQTLTEQKQIFVEYIERLRAQNAPPEKLLQARELFKAFEADTKKAMEKLGIRESIEEVSA